MKKNLNNTAKTIIFILNFFINFIVLQHIFVPKWYYPNRPLLEPMGRILPGFYEEDENTIDVLILGTSSSHFGISPMEMYETYHIKSYNLSTNGQPIEVSYFTLKEALKTQNPRVVVLDIGAVYPLNFSDVSWRYILDLMPLSRNKYDFAREYITQSNGESSMLDALIPLCQYHERWKELSERDFTDFFRNRRFYNKGFYMLSRQKEGETSREEMNDMVSFLESLPDERVITEYNEGIYSKENRGRVSYLEDTIPAESIKWLFKINQLCEENDIGLVATKVPAEYSPVNSRRVWTEKKYQAVSSICEQYNIPFVDLDYDVDIGIDWKKDTRDGGTHLNLSGARKVSSFLGQYLTDNYNLNTDIENEWKDDLQTYRQVREIGLLQLETDFISYLVKLNQNMEGTTILISASDEMSAGLSNEDILALRNLGLKTELEDKYRSSYIALIENGIVMYEGLSNDRISLEGDMSNDNVSYRIISSGYYTNPLSQIFIGDENWSVGGRGLNIVLYDNRRNIVLDSVCFDTCDVNHVATRNQDLVIERLREYENYVIENEARR